MNLMNMKLSIINNKKAILTVVISIMLLAIVFVVSTLLQLPLESAFSLSDGSKSNLKEQSKPIELEKGSTINSKELFAYSLFAQDKPAQDVHKKAIHTLDGQGLKDTVDIMKGIILP